MERTGRGKLLQRKDIGWRWRWRWCAEVQFNNTCKFFSLIIQTYVITSTISYSARFCSAFSCVCWPHTMFAMFLALLAFCYNLFKRLLFLSAVPFSCIFSARGRHMPAGDKRNFKWHCNQYDRPVLLKVASTLKKRWIFLHYYFTATWPFLHQPF